MIMENSKDAKASLFIYRQQFENEVLYHESDLGTLVTGNVLSQGAGKSTDGH